MSHTEHLYVLFLLSIFQTSYSKPTLHCHCNQWRPSHKWKREILVFFLCIDTMIRLRCYIYLIQIFYFINRLIEHNLYWFFYITEKKVSLFYFGSKVVSMIRINLLSWKKWSRCLSLTDHLSTLFIISFFKHLIQDWLSDATATTTATYISDNGQSLFVLLVALIHS